MRKTLLTVIVLLFSSLVFSADYAFLDSLIANAYLGQTMPRVQPTADGVHYAMLKDGSVLEYDFAKGRVSNTLYDKKKFTLLIDGAAVENSISAEGFVLPLTPGMPGAVARVSADNEVENDRYLLIYTNREQIFRHTFRADYYLVDTQRREVRPLSAKGKQQTPVFSPDKRYVAFVREGNIFIHKIEFNSEIQVTTDGDGVNILNGVPDWLYEEEFACDNIMAWSPDSKQLAFVKLDQSEVPLYTYLHYGTLVGTGHNQWSAVANDIVVPYPTAITYRYPKAGTFNALASVHVYDTYYKTIKEMQLPELYDSYIPRLRFTTSPDELAIFRLNRRQTRLEMFYANPKSTVSHSIYHEDGRGGAVDFSMIDNWLWTDDGYMIVMSEQDGWKHLFLYDAQGSKKQLLSSGASEVTRVYGVDELGNVFYQSADPSPMQRIVRMVNINAPKKVFTLTSLQGTHSAQFSANFKYFIDSYSSLEHPMKAEVVDNKSKVLRTIFDNKSFMKRWTALNLPKKQIFHFRTERRDDIDGWMLIPKDTAGRKCPLVLLQYSGPGSQMVLNRWRPGWEYYLVEQGYVVACIDPRGSGARGAAWRNKTYGQLGKLEAEDLISAGKEFAKYNFVDESRIAIWGWSYGGFQVLYTMGQPDHPFKAGIAVAPVTDWRFYDSAYTERYMNRPQENDQGYLNSSTMPLAKNLTGALMLACGTADDNVHFQNSMNYVHQLIEADKDFKLIVFPDENHYIRQGNSHKYLYHQKIKFLEEQLKR